MKANIAALRDSLLLHETTPVVSETEVVAGAIVLPPSLFFPPNDERARQAYHPVVLPKATGRVFDGGVYDAVGRIVRNAIHLGGNRRYLPAPAIAAEDLDRVSGRWLFAGVMFHHFGHFLTEGLGRLWAIPGDPSRLSGIVWLPQRPFPEHHSDTYAAMPTKGFHGAILRLLAPGFAHHVVLSPTRFQRLLVPPQLMLNAAGPPIAGDARFRKFVASRLVRQRPATLTLRVYVSRAGLKDSGRLLAESHIEEVLAASGWTIMRPETLSVDQQLEIYCAARDILFAEGSALHLFTMIAEKRQHVGVIFRRRPKAKYAHQLRAYGVEMITEIDAIEAFAATCSGNQGQITASDLNNAATLLDFERLGNALVEAGFVDRADWRLPSKEQIEGDIALLEAAQGERAAAGTIRLIPRSEFVKAGLSTAFEEDG